nr:MULTISPECIES: CoA transferase [Halorussus]
MSSQGPLSDLTVVEMTVHRAGPFCGALLADLGADVVKIERPGAGGSARDQGHGPAGKSGYFMANNRNKKSVTVDLKTDAGREATRDLLADADVFVENFGYGVTDKLGIGYDGVREFNEGIIYASIKGYGETGPAKEKKELDLILQTEGGDPVKVGRAIDANQSIQHPIAEAHARVQAAKQMTYAADETDGESADVGARQHVEVSRRGGVLRGRGRRGPDPRRFRSRHRVRRERYFREARLTRLVPITQQLALNYVSETCSGCPGRTEVGASSSDGSLA